MNKRTMQEMLESLCLQARNRFINWGIPEATIHVVDCRDRAGLHLDVRKNGISLGELHVWSPGYPDMPDSFFEEVIMEISLGILAAAEHLKFLEKLQELQGNLEKKFGAQPFHGGYLN